MESNCCYGRAFLSVGCNRELFISNLYQFVEFTIEEEIIDEMVMCLSEFSAHHIRVLHKNILQKKAIQDYIQNESQKHGRDMKKEATKNWIEQNAHLFNDWYENEFGNKFRTLQRL